MIKPNSNRSSRSTYLPKTPTKAKLLTQVATALTTVSLAACGGGGGGGGDNSGSDKDPIDALAATSASFVELPADTIQRIGTVTFDTYTYTNPQMPETEAVNIVFANAEFYDYLQPLSASYLESTFSLEKPDTCKIIIDRTDESLVMDSNKAPEIAEIDSNALSISAGSELYLLTPTNNWPNLLEEIYEPDEEYSQWFSKEVWYEFAENTWSLGDLPSGSSLNIPGNEFPAFDNVIIPEVQPLSDTSLSNVIDGRLTAESQVYWSAQTDFSQSSLTTVSVEFYEFDEEAIVDIDISIFCTVIDDGEFSFPDNVKQVLNDYDIPTEDLYLSRNTINTHVKDDAGLIIVRGSNFSSW